MEFCLGRDYNRATAGNKNEPAIIKERDAEMTYELNAHQKLSVYFNSLQTEKHKIKKQEELS